MLIGMHIMIDGIEHGVRYWPAVPRKGELVVCRFDGKAENVEVEQVVWGRMDGTHDYKADPMICNVYCNRSNAK